MTDTPAHDLRSALERLKFHADFQRGYGADDFSMRRSDADIILAALASDTIGNVAGRPRSLKSLTAGKDRHPPAAEPVACDLGPMHGKASTYTDASGVVCCDFCGHPAEPVGLREAVEGIDDDYMTSEKHHPGYVLIPTAKFEQIVAATERAKEIVQPYYVNWHDAADKALATPARTDDAGQPSGDVAAMREAAAKAVSNNYQEGYAAIISAIRALPLPAAEGGLHPDQLQAVEAVRRKARAFAEAAGVKDGLTSEEVGKLARILCKQAGYDPDGGPKIGYGWINYTKNAEEIIAALTPMGQAAYPNGVGGGSVEAMALAYVQAFYGTNFDPFTNPEAYDMSETATRAALATWRNGPTSSDMRAFAASEAACVLYPAEHQAAERAAFCEGAASAPGIALQLNRDLGMEGSAYDPPGPRRAYTFQHQPSNQPAYSLGTAYYAAGKMSAGDSIDRGLGLLKALEDQGFGVFEIERRAVG